MTKKEDKMIPEILLLLTVSSWLYWLTALWLVRSFFDATDEFDLDFSPQVSILKAVKGVDAQAYQNFASFCEQDYPAYEILFGVASADDPVIPLIERLQREYPQRDIRLIVSPVEGANRKAGMLHILAGQARCPILVMSDSDMRATPDYLQCVVAPLADPQVGLVTCLYRGESPVTLTARLEALHMGVTFLPSVLVGRKVISMHFAMGSTEAIRKRDLERLGGFNVMEDYLADDYQIGQRVANLGLRVHLSNYVITCILGVTTFKTQWNREVRWAQCNRISRPAEYPGLLLSFSTPLAALFWIASGFDWVGWRVLLLSVLLRWTFGWLVTGYTGDEVSRRWLFWLPLRDMLSAAIWLAGIFNRRITWRGESFELTSDGLLRPLAPSRAWSWKTQLGELLAGLVRLIDHILVRLYHIFEFNQEDRCLLRLSVSSSERAHTLSDGTCIQTGEPLGELHFWNEHIPPMPRNGPDLAWAITFNRQALYSLAQLAVFIEQNPRFDQIKAFRGDPPFGSRFSQVQLEVLAGRWGFDVITRQEPGGALGRFAEFWEDVYAFGLLWAFNPASIQGKGFNGIKHDQLWISRDTLLDKYGTRFTSNPSQDESRQPWRVKEFDPTGEHPAA
jgi:ceramide glucosyltransferase